MVLERWLCQWLGGFGTLWAFETESGSAQAWLMLIVWEWLATEQLHTPWAHFVLLGGTHPVGCVGRR